MFSDVVVAPSVLSCVINTFAALDEVHVSVVLPEPFEFVNSVTVSGLAVNVPVCAVSSFANNANTNKIKIVVMF
tara:strand:- start:91 stop:312 length:222 start_codon:yes stop_codon:yes gene_type:complete